MTRPGLTEDQLAVVALMREPPGHVTDAMATARKAAEKRNGHGQYAFRDMWIAGIDALLRGQP